MLFDCNQKFGFVNTSGGTDPVELAFRNTSGISGGGGTEFIIDIDDTALLNMSGMLRGGILVDIGKLSLKPSGSFNFLFFVAR